MRKSNLLGGALLLAALFVNTSCKEIFGNMDLSGDTTVSSYVAINTATKTAAPAEEFTLSITKIGDGTVTWSSSDPAIAEVQGAGLSAKVIAKKSGNATITANVAAAGNYQAGSAKCAVAVRISTIDQLTAEVGGEGDAVTAYLADNAKIEMTSDYKIKRDVKIIGSEKGLATLTMGAKGFEVKNSNFALENVIIVAGALENAVVRYAAPTLADGEIAKQVTFDFINSEVKDMKYQFIYGNKKSYLLKELNVKKSIIGIKGLSKKAIFDFSNQEDSKGANVLALNVEESTIYADATTVWQNGGFFTSQSSKKVSNQYGLENPKQVFTIKNSTLYNIANGKTTSTLIENSNDCQSYVVENNIIVNCGKNGQFLAGLNAGQAGKTKNWTVSNNVINWNNVDVSGTELSKINTTTITPISGEVSFADAAKGDFTQTLTKDAGDPRWKK